MTHAPITLTVLFDNVTTRPDLTPAHGFACLIENIEGGPVLFDAGCDPNLLLGNMAALGKDPKAVTTVVVSHPHWDHTGGLFGFLHAAGPGKLVYLPKVTLKLVVEHIRFIGGEPIIVENPITILPGLYSIGEMTSEETEKGSEEQSLVIDTAQGPAVLTGCAHPGVVAIAKRAKDLHAKTPTHVIGGFHLFRSGPKEVAAAIAGLHDLGVRRVATSHCTGQNGVDAFRNAWGEDFVPLGCGAVIQLPAVA